jgi:3-methyladenine DNA glycosylase/8-oxoguanine DNA glycosylase
MDYCRALEHLSHSDRRLARLIERVGTCQLQADLTQSIFDALLESIVYQQLTGKAAATILGRVKALFGDGRFPTPLQVGSAPEELLRSAGLSRAKTAALKDLAAKALDGTVPSLRRIEKMSDAEIVDRLISIRGVGVWTVEMLLIFRLGRLDVLPTSDYGVRKGFARTFKTTDLPKPVDVLARGERWRPYRSIASWYLWRAAEM